METYPLTVQNGHLIFEQSQRKFLIDTGSPISFGSDTLHLQGVEHRLHNDPCTLNQINSSSLFNVGIDGLIGTDILHDLIFTVYQKEGKIVFGENPIEFHTTINCHSTLMGVLTCDVSVNHRDYKAVIDTGSSLPYATASVVEGLQPTTNVKDFSPIYGDMSADAL